MKMFISRTLESIVLLRITNAILKSKLHKFGLLLTLDFNIIYQPSDDSTLD